MKMRIVWCCLKYYKHSKQSGFGGSKNTMIGNLAWLMNFLKQTAWINIKA